jgi:hypothetical protein
VTTPSLHQRHAQESTHSGPIGTGVRRLIALHLLWSSTGSASALRHPMNRRMRSQSHDLCGKPLRGFDAWAL